MKNTLLTILFFGYCYSALAQYSVKLSNIIGIRVGGSLAKYKFNQFPSQPPSVNGAGFFNTYSTVSPSLQSNFAISLFYKTPISRNNWLDFEAGIRTRGYKSYYAFVDRNLILQPYVNRFLTAFSTVSLQLKLTQIWYFKPGIRMDVLLCHYTNPNFAYWTSYYSTLEPSPVLATGIILPRINLELEVNPGLANLVTFPADYMASRSSLRSFSMGLNLAYKLGER